MPRRQRILEL